MVGKRFVREDQHGSTTGYTYGCRCILCKRAITEYHSCHNIDRRKRDDDFRIAQNEIQYERKHKRRNMLSIIKMSKGCADCGFKAHPDALHFDHLPEFEKSFTIGASVTFGLDRIMKEVEKCEVVCANCHQIRTSHRRVGFHMKKELIDYLENGEVAILIYQLEDGSKRWWLRAGAMLLEFTETTFKQLIELVQAISEEGV